MLYRAGNQPLEDMRNKKSVQIVVWMIVVAMVLSLAAVGISFLT